MKRQVIGVKAVMGNMISQSKGGVSSYLQQIEEVSKSNTDDSCLNVHLNYTQISIMMSLVYTAIEHLAPLEERLQGQERRNVSYYLDNLETITELLDAV